ncbi:MAG: XRE family transcriptional regulator [Sphaerochaetaceae bacterium]|nr:XRE family transcriptional regulator [Sphaerochaetaceae bacterium]
MPGLSQSFLDYVMDAFHDQLFGSVENYINENVSEIQWRAVELDPDTAELAEIAGKRIIIANTPATALEFDVVVEAEVELSEVTHHRNDSDECTEWFRISCTGDLEKGLLDFETGTVCVYRSEDNPVDFLGASLTPYLSGRQLDDIAAGLLQHYCPETLNDPAPINADILASRMGLDIEEKWLSADSSTYGAMFFCDCDVDLIEENTLQPQKHHVNARTIVVDPRSRIGMLNFTKIHECSHWELHRKWFLFQHLINKDFCHIACSETFSSCRHEERSETEWLEWQANSLAARILMPYKQFQIKTQSLISYYISELAPRYEVEVLELIIDDLASFFGASRMAATIRMVDVGFKEALGINNYVDGHHVPAHAFKREAIERNQTFSISFQDLCVAYLSNPDIKRNIIKGSLVFVESHICLNAPKFIEKDPDGYFSLTGYARFHMDECCLLFDVAARSNGDRSKLVYDCALCRGASSNVVFEATIATKGANPVLKEAEAFQGFNHEMQEVIAGLPIVFGPCLKYLMKWAGTTQEQLAERSGMDSKTIRNMINIPTHELKLESVIALCIGLRLPFTLSIKLIKSAGLSFMYSNPNHMAYETLLMYFGKWTIEQCNKCLIEQGAKPLNRA